MKIAEVRLLILENPAQPERNLRLVQVPNLLRIQYTHSASAGSNPARQHILEVTTDTGITSRCTTTMQPHQAQLLRNQVVGGSISRPAGSATSTTACGTLRAKPRGCPSMRW